MVSLLPLTIQMLGLPKEERPAVVYWFQQSLSIPMFPKIRKPIERTYSELYQYHDKNDPIIKIAKSIAPEHIVNKGSRLGFIADIQWLHEHELIDLFVLSSTYYAEYFERCGIPSIVVPRGYHPIYGDLQQQERDIAVTWMGKLRTRRRRDAVHWIREQIEKQGRMMHIYDGVENDFIFGPARNSILNRTWFVPNVYFSGPADELSIRYFVAGSNGAVTITEAGYNRYRFMPGEHFVECDVKEMPDIVDYYMNHEDEWQTISSNMHNLIKHELTLENTMLTILSHVEKVVST